jgi:Protein of unknown function (DUF2568)
VTGSERVLLLLRVTVECLLVAGFAFWGLAVGGSTWSKILLGIAVPAAGFGFWGAVDFKQSGRYGEAARLAQELMLSMLAAAAWYFAGQRGLGILLAALSVVYHSLVYATGGRLLKPDRSGAPSPTHR